MLWLKDHSVFSHLWGFRRTRAPSVHTTCRNFGPHDNVGVCSGCSLAGTDAPSISPKWRKREEDEAYTRNPSGKASKPRRDLNGGRKAKQVSASSPRPRTLSLATTQGLYSTANRHRLTVVVLRHPVQALGCPVIICGPEVGIDDACLGFFFLFLLPGFLGSFGMDPLLLLQPNVIPLWY